MLIISLLTISLLFSVVLLLDTHFNGDIDDLIFALILTCCILVSLTITIIQPIDSYKQAQIDALNGKVKYELITHPDSTRVWVKILEEK